MSKKLWRIGAATLVVGAAAVAGVYLAGPQPAAAVECDPCGGPTRSASASGSALSRGAAETAAFNNAVLNAFQQSPPGCIPCQVQQTWMGCAFAHRWVCAATISHRCQDCTVGGGRPPVP